MEQPGTYKWSDTHHWINSWGCNDLAGCSHTGPDVSWRRT